MGTSRPQLELEMSASLGDCYFVLSSGKESLLYVLLDSICKDDLTTRRRRHHLVLHSLVIRTSVDLGPLFRVWRYLLWIPSRFVGC